MNPEEIKARIRTFLQKQNLAIVSTVSQEHAPESALVAFAENDNLEIVFGTSNTTRKYANLRQNPKTAFVMGWSSEVGTVQYEGVAKELEKEESAPYAALLVRKNPFSETFVKREDQRYFLVTPTWVRIFDGTEGGGQVYEVQF